MHKFIEYPSQIQSIEFSEDSSADRQPIESRSIDGLQVKFQVQFQYTLDKNKLRDLYLTYGENYRDPCIRFAVDIFNDRATAFKASMFFKDLGAVQEDMRKAIVTVFNKECYSYITTLQVSKAKLPYDYENALQNTQLAGQAGITANQTQQNVMIDMVTKVGQARISAPIVINQAEAKINATLATNLAQAKSFQSVTASESSSYKEMKSQLSFTPDQLLEYIRIKTISNYNKD